ncbi:PP2C family protein-serine/threonine phosphatase [Gordonia sp. NPDC057258]|uniref:PP2C family protein-serine/threonine phosphatase n=1 Tax=unclassified Gordonia (in: high G+C Gram-positive bacteria) TaxID=2657482 RepID=UPI001CF9CF52|nr:PP2C family serine/threonine-protein phosphatase [Gordonia sp. WA4-43]UCZ88346.1 protein phosphatase 2C domain-containing protein [Gordonia sp. WA4-43]
MTLVLRYIARSDRGLVRSNNEDSFYAGPRLLALADGMGGHAAGEVASQLVIRALSTLDDDEPGGDLLTQLDSATRAGNEAIAAQVQESPELDGMGTTLTAILFAGSRIGLCHIGDSRGYMYRDGALTQITRDDTFVQTLVDEGRITAEQAHTHPQRSLIMRALTGTEVEPTLTMREARAGDRYMLCSDGLSDVVTEDTIAETLGSIADPKECADRLIELALRGGGPDNVTVVLADVVDTQYGDSRPIVGGAAGANEEIYTPDPATAAGRAAALRPPPAEPQRPTVLTEDEPPAKHKSKYRRWIVAGVALAVIVALVVGIFVVRAIVRSNYYVAADDTGDVLIYQGSPEKVFFLSMSNPVQRVCVEDLDQAEPSYTFISYDASCEFPLNVDDLVSGPAQSVKNVMIRNKSEEQIQGVVTDELTFRCDNAPSSPSPAPTPPAPAPSESTPSTDPSAPAPRATAAPAPGIPQQGATESVAPSTGNAGPADTPAPDQDAVTSCRQQVR